MNRTAQRFFANFTNVFYDFGFADCVEGSGVLGEQNDLSDDVRALAYIKGYADACRLANAYMSSRWHACNLLGIVAGIALANDCTLTHDQISSYHNEFRDLLRRYTQCTLKP